MFLDNCCLAIDAMGGDCGPHLTVPASVAALNTYPLLRLRLYGDEQLLSPVVDKLPAQCRQRLDIVHCSQVVSMDEKPATALRRLRDSSMWHALKAVAEGEAQACVSAGNTGALMAMGMALLGTLPGIERPAICTAVPTYAGRAYLLDMGANLECTAEHLLQFAHMASAMVSLVEEIPAPRVGLLNVGREQNKGDGIVREAAQKMAADERINYVGFVEGDGIFSGDFDIVVCDGFVGNVALKSSEGVARMIATLLNQNLAGSWLTRLGALLARGGLERLQRRIDPSQYNGASLLGLGGVVIKSHGGASQAGFEHALQVAVGEAGKNVPRRISVQLDHTSISG